VKSRPTRGGVNGPAQQPTLFTPEKEQPDQAAEDIPAATTGVRFIGRLSGPTRIRSTEDAVYAIRGLSESAQEQIAVFKMLDRQEKKKGKTITPGIIEQLIKDAATGPVKKSEQATLFGPEYENRPLLMERAELRDYASSRLASDRALFAGVAKQARAAKLAEAGNIIDTESSQAYAEQADTVKRVFDTLASAKGPISDLLNQYSEELANAESKAKRDDVKARFLQALKSEAPRAAGGRAGADTEQQGGGKRAGGDGQGGLFDTPAPVDRLETGGGVAPKPEPPEPAAKPPPGETGNADIDELLAYSNQVAGELADKERAEAAQAKIKSGLDKIKAGTKAFNDLFGKKGEVGPDLEMDPERWAKVKEALDLIWEGVLETTEGVMEAAREFIRHAMEALSSEGKPYVDKYIREEIAQALAAEKAKPAPAAAPETKVEVAGYQALSDWVKQKIQNKEAFTWRELFSQADTAFGGTQAAGVYSSRDAYDAMELGVNRAIRESLATDPTLSDVNDAAAQVRALKRIVEGLPTQTRRTEEQDAYQQFSTPPFLAYAVNWVANLSPDDVVLEPSAGNGGLAVFAKNAGAQVIVNELSPRRAEILGLQDFDRVFTENAEQIDNVLPEDVRPTAVVMNPPFSSTAGRVKTNNTKYGGQHVEQALARLEPDGRLVAIVGAGMADDAPAFSDFWKRIKGKYNVRANVGISGDEYQKYGTTFDNRILVIDKTGKDDNLIVTGKVGGVEDLLPLLKEVRDDRQAPRKPETDHRGEPAKNQQTRPEPADKSGPGAASGTTAHPSTGGLGGGKGGARPARQPTGDAGGVRRPAQRPGKGVPDSGEIPATAAPGPEGTGPGDHGGDNGLADRGTGDQIKVSAAENRADQEISEEGEINEPQKFTLSTPEKGQPDKAAGEISVSTGVRFIGRLSGPSHIRTTADAIYTLRGLSESAQEQLHTITTDAAGKGLEAHQYF
jgi:hypothetical protein